MTVGEPCLKQPVTLWPSGTHGFGTGFGSAGFAHGAVSAGELGLVGAVSAGEVRLIGAVSAGELGLFGGTFLGSCRA